MQNNLLTTALMCLIEGALNLSTVSQFSAVLRTLVMTLALITEHAWAQHSRVWHWDLRSAQFTKSWTQFTTAEKHNLRTHSPTCPATCCFFFLLILHLCAPHAIIHNLLGVNYLLKFTFHLWKSTKSRRKQPHINSKYISDTGQTVWHSVQMKPMVAQKPFNMLGSNINT